MPGVPNRMDSRLVVQLLHHGPGLSRFAGSRFAPCVLITTSFLMDISFRSISAEIYL